MYTTCKRTRVFFNTRRYFVLNFRKKEKKNTRISNMNNFQSKIK